MALRSPLLLSALRLLAVRGLENGLARTPPMGFNSYMTELRGERGLGLIADFFVSSGMREDGYAYVNTDEGWEVKARDARTGALRWSLAEYPSGLPAFISRLHERGLKYGIYGAASGVTCGELPGQLYHEDLDAATYAAWGVDYLKSDNCASYALDPSVRFAAMRDALNRTGRPVVLSVEPFSVRPDVEQGPRVANLWRVGCDIVSDFGAILARADLSDKWAPLAGPGGWNDPDMINLRPGLSPGENRVYFALWAVMKAPLLLSSDLTKLDASLMALVRNRELIAVNQDSLGVQARKLAADGRTLPWLVSLAACDEAPAEFYARGTGMGAGSGWPSGVGADTRVWSLVPIPANTSEAPTFALRNLATDRCLSLASSRSPSKLPGVVREAVVLLPCRKDDPAQHWRFDKGLHTVTSITSVAAGLALAVPNATLTAAPHGGDQFQVPDVAYGDESLTLVAPYDQEMCSTRFCENYDPSQMWYFSPSEGLLRHATYTASINHRADGEGYTLTRKVPTWRHHCLAHTLSTSNSGTAHGETEVWAGPLSGGALVVALVNRGPAMASIRADFSDLADGGARVAKSGASFDVRDILQGKDLGRHSNGFSVSVPSHDIAVFKLSPSSVPLLI